MQMASGRFLTGTGSVGSSVNLGVGFEPDLILFWGSGMPGTSTTPENAHHMHFGWHLKNGDDFCIATKENNSSGDNTGATRTVNDCCVMSLLLNNGAATVDGKMAVTNLSGGVTVEVTDQFATTRRVSWLAIEGIQVEMGTLAPGGAGNLTVSGHGFEGNLALFACPLSPITAFPGNHTANAGLGIGLASVAQSGIAMFKGGRDDNNNVTAGYSRGGECIAGMRESLNGLGYRASFVGFTSDGFTVNFLNRQSATVIPYLLIKGDELQVFTFNTPTNTSEFSVSLDGTPEGLWLVSSLRPQDAAGTPGADALFSMGAAYGVLDQHVAAMNSYRIGGTNTNARKGQLDTSAILRITNGANTVARRLVVNSFESDGFKAQMAETGVTSAFQVFGLAFLGGLAMAGDTLITTGGQAIPLNVRHKLWSTDVPRRGWRTN